MQLSSEKIYAMIKKKGGSAMLSMIAKRKSCRSYTDVPVSEELLEKIRSFEMKPLYPEIGVEFRIVTKDQVRNPCPFKTEQLIAIYSEKKDGYLENVGFMFQQMDLYLQSLGLGVCWLGMGRPREGAEDLVPGLEYVIALTIGYPEGDMTRKELSEFNRVTLAEISDREDEKLEPARLAPSSCNSQPWHFVHTEDAIRLYWDQKGLAVRAQFVYFNPIDIGICLAHLYLANAETFSFFKEENVPEIPGHVYMGSFTL